ncbi:MAG: CvpA family protein [Limisphaerales bacterium]
MFVAIIGFGLFRGRRNGMAKELLPFFQWIVLVAVCGLGYEMVGQIFINTMRLDKMWSFIWGYVILAVVIYIIFSLLKKPVAKKMEGSNMFGGSEYYLGMVAGMIRFFCILLMALALLNAPFYTAAQVQQHIAYVKKNYGGGSMSGDFFPTLQEVQEGVFVKSFTGPYIKEYLGMLLINSVAPGEAKKAQSPNQKPAGGTITIKK